MHQWQEAQERIVRKRCSAPDAQDAEDHAGMLDAILMRTKVCELIVHGLTRFKTYSFRVVAVGAAGLSIPSDAASATAA